MVARQRARGVARQVESPTVLFHVTEQHQELFHLRDALYDGVEETRVAQVGEALQVREISCTAGSACACHMFACDMHMFA